MAMESQETFWDLVQEIDSCMLTTLDGDKLRSRPMVPRIDLVRGEIQFLTSLSSAKIADVEAEHHVNLAFVDASAGDYVSVSGTMRVSTDRPLVRELWSPMAKMWFKNGPDDPDVAVLRCTPQDAQYWDGTGNVIKKYWEILRAVTSEHVPDLGENRKVQL
jgi:general stress protein 26